MMTGIKQYRLVFGWVSVFFFMVLSVALSSENIEPSPVDGTGFHNPLWQKLEQGVELNFKATALGEINGIAGSDQNPGNRFAQLSDNRMVLTLKPDMTLVYDDWRFSAKPRLEFERNQYSMDGQTRKSSGKTADIIEFQAQRPLLKNLFASYGWENLQWGPSFLYSPSNPFFNDNGKKSLVQDLEGKGFLKLIFVHDFQWSASLIYNTDKGAFDESEFEKTLALKIDYSGNQSYATLILSHTDQSETRIGAFGGTTLSDAVIIYGEARLVKGNPALFPVAVQGPLAWDMAAIKKESDTLYATLLAGMGYTFETGDTLTMEVLYYGQGYDSTQALNFKHLKKTGADFYAANTALSGYGAQLLGKASGNGLDFLRQNYLMLQYINEDIIPDVDLVSRVIFCPDDGSSRLYSSFSLDLNDHTELKISGMVNTGGSDASFGTFLDYQIQTAVEYSF